MPRNLLLAIAVIFFGIIAFDMMGILVRLLGGMIFCLHVVFAFCT